MDDQHQADDGYYRSDDHVRLAPVRRRQKRLVLSWNVKGMHTSTLSPELDTNQYGCLVLLDVARKERSE